MKMSIKSPPPVAIVNIVFSSVLFSFALFSPNIMAEEMDSILHWLRTVSLSTPVSGVVVEVDAIVGGRVKKGQVLLKLDDRVTHAQVEALKAALNRAKNNRDESGREMDRTQELYDRTLISEHELELARILRDDGEAEYQLARAGLVQAEVNLEYSTVRAPFSGWVIQRNVEIGQTVISELQAEPLVVMVGADQMIARAQLPGEQLSKLSVGRKAKVVIGQTVFQGSISQIGLLPLAGTKNQYNVDVVFDLGGKFYRAGQAAKVSF